VGGIDDGLQEALVKEMVDLIDSLKVFETNPLAPPNAGKGPEFLKGDDTTGNRVEAENNKEEDGRQKHQVEITMIPHLDAQLADVATRYILTLETIEEAKTSFISTIYHHHCGKQLLSAVMAVRKGV
jgi:hypothetical protein